MKKCVLVLLLLVSVMVVAGASANQRDSSVGFYGDYTGTFRPQVNIRDTYYDGYIYEVIVAQAEDLFNLGHHWVEYGIDDSQIWHIRNDRGPVLLRLSTKLAIEFLEDAHHDHFYPGDAVFVEFTDHISVVPGTPERVPRHFYYPREIPHELIIPAPAWR